MTPSEIVIEELSDAGLLNFYAYWRTRLRSRGGGWIAEILQLAACDQLQEIEAEIKRRGLKLPEQAQS